MKKVSQIKNKDKKAHVKHVVESSDSDSEEEKPQPKGKGKPVAASSKKPVVEEDSEDDSDDSENDLQALLKGKQQAQKAPKKEEGASAPQA